MSSGLTLLLKNSTVLMVARIIGGGLAFAVNIMIVRWFGADVLGEFALAMAAASLVAVLLPTGMQSVAIMFASQYAAKDQMGHALGYIRTGYRHIAILTLLCGALLAVGAVVAANFVERSTLVVAGFGFLIAPALALINFNCCALTGLKRQFLGLMPDLLIKPAFMFVAIAALGLLAGGASTPTVMMVICAAMWMTALGQWVLMRRSLDFSQYKADTADKAVWRKASLPWIAIAIMWDYFIELHLLLAGLLLAPSQIGLLHICFRLRVLAAFGTRALHSLVMPDVFAADAKGDHDGFKRGLAKINILTLGYSLSVCAGVLLAGDIILGLVDDSFRAGYPLLVLICASMISRAVFGPSNAMMAMKGLQLSVIWILGLGFAISLLLCLVLFPIYGVAAIAIAYLTAMTFITAFQWWWLKKETGIDCSIFAEGTLPLLRQKITSSLARV